MSTSTERGTQLQSSYLVAGMIDERTVKALWPTLRPFIQAALEHSENEITEEQLLDQILADKAQIWLVYNGVKILGVATTERIEYPNTIALRIITLSGQHMERWQGLLAEKLIGYGRHLGAQRLEFVGRKGFERSLASLGFKPAYLMMTKDISKRSDILHISDRREELQ